MRRVSAWWVFALVLSSSAFAERPKLLVLELTGSGVDQAQLASVTDRVSQLLDARGVFDLISAREVQTMLGMERQRALLGCAEGSSCLAELTGALGARFFVSGTLVRLGDTYQLTLQCLDAQRAQPVGRGVRLGATLAEVLEGLPLLVAQVTGLPPPPEPSKVLPLVLIGAGAAGIVTGGVLGVQALTQEAALQGELTGTALSTRVSYLERARGPATMKTISVATLAGGAVLVGLGVLFWPRGIAGSGVAVLPSTSGVTVAGVLP